MAEQKQENPKSFPWKRWVLGFGIAVFALWVISWIYAQCAFDDMAGRGQFGDQFGAVNALFSGLAFAILFVALLMQSRELELQRRQLQLQIVEQRQSREQLARTASAQEQSLQVWRDELQARPRYDLARRVLLAACKTREAFLRIRHVVFLSTEAECEPDLDQTVGALLSRFRSYNELWTELESLQMETEVLWGAEDAKWLKPLRDRVHDYWAKLLTATNITQGIGPGSFWSEETPHLNEIRKTLVEIEIDDTFRVELEEEIKELKTALQNQLQGHGLQLDV